MPVRGFAAWSNDCPTDWRVSKDKDETGKCTADKDVSHSGLATLAVGQIANRFVLIHKPISIDPKVSYVVFCWMKCQKAYAAHGVMEVALLDGAGLPVGPVFSEGVSADSEFIERRIEVPAEQIPPEAVAMEVRLGVRGKTAGTVWFDDLAIVPRRATISLSSPKPSNLFHAGESVVFSAKIYSCLQTNEPAQLKMTLTDFWGREYEVLSEARRLPSRKTFTKLVPVPPHGLGYFKLTATLMDKAGRGLDEETADLAVVSPFSEAVWGQDSPFGSHGLGVNADKLLPLMREAYVKWVRIGIHWGSIERKAGQYDFAGLEKTFKPYLDNHIQALPVISGIPEWISSYRPGMPTGFLGGTYWAYPPTDYRAFTGFCERLSAQFKGRIRFWEMWNEPNGSFWMGTPQDFARLLAAGYTGLHKGDPDCQVIFEVAGIDLGYWDTVYQNGGKGFFDILAAHNYQLPHPGPPEQSQFLAGYYRMKKFLADRGESSKPIWDTEFCWMSKSPLNRPGWKGVGERNQANYLVRSWTLALSAGVKRMFWFPFYSYGGGELNEPHPGGLVRADFAIKPVFVAHRVMAECLAGATYLHSIDVGENAQCYVFQKADGQVAVTWSSEYPEHPGRVNLATGDARLRHVNVMGDSTDVDVYGGILTVPVSASPCFLFSKTSFHEASGAASEEMLVKLIEKPTTVRGLMTAAVQITNRKKEELKATLRVIPPAAWPPPAPPRKIKIQKGETRSSQISCSLPSSSDLFGHVAVEVLSRNSLLRLDREVPLVGQVVAAPVTGKDLKEWAAEDNPSVIWADEAEVQPLQKICAAYDNTGLYLALSAARQMQSPRRGVGRPDFAEFMLDVNDDGHFDAPAGDFWAQVGFTPGEGTVRRQYLPSHRPASPMEGAEAWVSETPDEMVCRMRLPYACLHLKGQPALGSTVGIGVVLHYGNGETVSWPPGFRRNAQTTGQIAFSWRAAGGDGSPAFRRTLLKNQRIEAIVTKLPAGRAYRYQIFASEARNPSEDLSSLEWQEVVPVKVGSGIVVDRVDVHARHFATRFTSAIADPSFEGIAVTGPVNLQPGQLDLRLWQPDRSYCSIVTTAAHSGAASAYVPAVGRTLVPRERWSNWRQTVPAEHDTDYTLSGYVKIGEMQDGSASLRAHTFNWAHPEKFTDHGPARAVPEAYGGRPGWQFVQTTLHTGPLEDRIQIFCGVFRPSADRTAGLKAGRLAGLWAKNIDVEMNGSAWFDDVCLIEGPIATDVPQVIGQQFLKKPGWFEKWPQFAPAR